MRQSMESVVIDRQAQRCSAWVVLVLIVDEHRWHFLSGNKDLARKLLDHYGSSTAVVKGIVPHLNHLWMHWRI